MGVEEKCLIIIIGFNLDMWGFEGGFLKEYVLYVYSFEDYSEDFLVDVIGNGYLYMGV